jgi:hypothetical protein
VFDLFPAVDVRGLVSFLAEQWMMINFIFSLFSLSYLFSMACRSFSLISFAIG